MRASGEEGRDPFRLESYAPDIRVDMWREVVSQTFTPLSPEPLCGAEFGAGLDTLQRADVKLSMVSGTPQKVLRGPRELSRSKASAIFLNIQLEGESLVRHARGETVLRPGDCALVNPHEPFALELGSPFQQLSIHLPDWWLAEQAELPVEMLAGLRIDMREGSGRVLDAAIAALIAASPDDQASCDELVLLLYDIVNRTTMMAARRERSATALQSAQVRNAERLRQFVEAHFGDEDLSPAAAAQALGCSVRNIHKICVLTGTTFGRLVMEKRLVAAARMLTLGHDAARIGEIAYECGFGDLSHFSRSFRKRFGTSPRGFRRSAPASRALS